MPRSLNRCTFIGSLVADPDGNGATDGTANTKFVLQVPETNHRATFVPITAQGKVAEVANKILRRGSEVYVEGQFKARMKPGKDGTPQLTVEILMENMQLLSDRPSIKQSDVSTLNPYD